LTFTIAAGEEHPERLVHALDGVCRALEQSPAGTKKFNDVQMIAGLATAVSLLANELSRRLA
jgi:hypothetical protein